MAVLSLHRHHRNGKDSSLLSSPKLVMGLLVGWLMGALCMYLLMVFWLGQRLHDDHAESHAADVPTIPQEKYDGWQTLHVFYGKQDGLKIPTQQKWFSQVHQDEIVVDLIQRVNHNSKDHSQNYYFIDLAANDAKEFSNTLALEQHGWEGLCIEPNPTYWYDLSHRKCTVVGALVGGDTVERVEVKFRGVYGGMLGKMDVKLANRKREPPAPTQERYTAPLGDVLQQFHVPNTVHYLSLDVEGMEFDILQHFPFDKIVIQILTVERPTPPLRRLLEQNGYLFLKDLAWWGETLWAHKSTGLSPAHPKIVQIQTEERN